MNACGARGAQLGSLLNELIDDQADEEQPRDEIVAAMGSAAGIEPSTVNQILSGSINCPPRSRLAAFARVLGVAVERLLDAAESDGCNYGDRSARGDELRRALIGRKCHRPIVFVRASDDDEDDDEHRGPVTAVLSTETPVRTFFGNEILVHSPESIDLSRDAGNGFPLLWDHSTRDFIGRLRGVGLDGSGRLVADDIEFSPHSLKGRQIESEVRDGFLDSLSIGYRIEDFELDEETDDYRVTRWSLLEASVVPVPADPNARVTGRNHEGDPMPDDVGQTGDGSPERVVQISDAQRRARERGQAEGARAEQRRQRAIGDAFAPFIERAADDPEAFTALRDACLSDVECDEATANRQLLRLLGARSSELPDARRPGASDYRQSARGGFLDGATLRDLPESARFRAGADRSDQWAEGVETALLLRAGLIADREKAREARAGNHFVPMPLFELARSYLDLCGVNLRGMNRLEIVGQAFVRQGLIAQGTSDFASILANVATKAMLMGFNEAPETWSTWTGRMSLPDFKQATLPSLSLFSDLAVVQESGEFQYGKFSDIKEQIQLETRGRIFSLSRQAIINDDLNAFSRIAPNMGRSAQRTIGDLVYAILTSNPTMIEDATTLFHANHGNDVAGGSGAAPSVVTLDAARTAMATQKDPSTLGSLGIRPAYLIVPEALATTAEVLLEAEFDPAGTAGTLTPNPFRSRMVPVADHRLDDADAAEWFVAADPRLWDTIAVAFLDGTEEPFLDSKDGWAIDGVEWKVRLDVGVAATGWRGLYRNDGN